ncbi:MAG: hypothetical protein ACXW08_12075 [Solirubrobacteraceae bacterium]
MSADAASVLAEVARAAVAAQTGLDSLAEAGARRWDDTGIPPWAGAYAGLRGAVETRVGVEPRSRAGQPSRLLLLGAGRNRSLVGFSVSLRPSGRS